MNLSKKGIDLIIFYETGGSQYYKKYLTHPVFPGAFSGVTIGCGYDLGYNTEDQFTIDWKMVLNDNDFYLLSKCLGVKGDSAKKFLDKIKDVTIPWEKALKVFEESTIPRFYNLTLKTFPGIEKLCPDAMSSIVSIVFNRGSSLKGDSRREMREIVKLVPKKDYKGIANQIRSMKRLWEGKGLEGLLKRRDAESDLVESCS
jgi:hypothetical protein